MNYVSLPWGSVMLGKIIFEFLGGCMNGRTVEGDGDDGQRLERLDPVLNYWIDSYFGRIGHHFYIKVNGTPPQDDLYEVVGRLDDEDGETLVLAEYRPDPRD